MAHMVPQNHRRSIGRGRAHGGPWRGAIGYQGECNGSPRGGIGPYWMLCEHVVVFEDPLLRIPHWACPIEDCLVRHPRWGSAIKDSRIKIPYWDFPIEDSLVGIPFKGFPIRDSLFRICYCGFLLGIIPTEISLLRNRHWGCSGATTKWEGWDLDMLFLSFWFFGKRLDFHRIRVPEKQFLKSRHPLPPDRHPHSASSISNLHSLWSP